ncbi:hypothetical protein [Nocardia goodfellowii]|uniref:Co-chaperonin GroES (HSP10) n=1 Tax=Nocardia goodfellowii TaxID=882446 RepID=A0ABS4QUK1_9NOCA|nr:hypothetical protein [Nocardia goodfellowii]MBP2194291.1 co-chaperonin GroES (HSP10) [Nocardia goodfellowii]
MTAPAQVFTAKPPTPPTAAPAVPGAPVLMVDAPRPPHIFTDGSRIPDVPPFVYAAFAGSATNTPQLKPTATAKAMAGGGGMLTAVAWPLSQWISPKLGDQGTATARVAVGAGGRVIVAASFGGETRTATGNAVFSATAELSAPVIPHSAAAAAFGTTGTSATTRFGPLPMAGSGTGTFSMAVAPPFSPSGMSKGGDQNLTGSWADVTGWYADTGLFPGSTISGSALIARGTALNVVVSASIPYAIFSGFGGPRQAVRLLVNGAVVATGAEATGWSGTMTAKVTMRIDAGDRVTVQGWSSHGAAVLDGTATQVRIVRAPA